MVVSEKLKKTAIELQIPFNRVSVVFALERLVARLETDPVLSEGLTYKGGFVLFKTAATDRYTRDVDATSRSVAKNVLTRKLLRLWELDLKDGIAYSEPEITELQIAEGDYGGIRLTLRYQLDRQTIETAKIKKLPRINLDICIGDTGPEVVSRADLSSITKDSEKVSWKVLSLYYIFAEKLQTMIIRSEANSRGKDVYDMWFLSKSLQNLDDLRAAIKQVFLNRKTDLPTDFSAVSQEINLDSLRKSWGSVQLKPNSVSFDQAFSELVTFLNKL